MYFDNSNSRSKVIGKDVHWGDTTFQAGARVDTELKYKTYELAFEYAFLCESSYEMAASLGVHAMDTSFQLSGQATITRPDGTVSNTATVTRKDSFTAPLPVIGIRAGWVVAPQWYIDAQAQLFKISYGDYDGT